MSDCVRCDDDTLSSSSSAADAGRANIALSFSSAESNARNICTYMYMDC